MDKAAQILADATGPLLGFALRLSGDRDQAEDLVQETIARALRARSRSEESTLAKPVLFRILRNLWIDHRRRAHRGPLLIPLTEDADGAAHPPICVTDRDLEALQAGGLSDELESALASLDEAWRATLWLRSVEGFSYSEIAEITEVPVGTVRSRLSRARRALARRLIAHARREGIVPIAVEGSDRA